MYYSVREILSMYVSSFLSWHGGRLWYRLEKETIETAQKGVEIITVSSTLNTQVSLSILHRPLNIFLGAVDSELRWHKIYEYEILSYLAGWFVNSTTVKCFAKLGLMRPVFSAFSQMRSTMNIHAISEIRSTHLVTGQPNCSYGNCNQFG